MAVNEYIFSLSPVFNRSVAEHNLTLRNFTSNVGEGVKPLLGRDWGVSEMLEQHLPWAMTATLVFVLLWAYAAWGSPAALSPFVYLAPVALPVIAVRSYLRRR